MPISLRFWECGCPKRRNAEVTVTSGLRNWAKLKHIFPPVSDEFSWVDLSPGLKTAVKNDILLVWNKNRIWRGTLGGTQYRNTVRKIGKYRNTVSKIDEIPIPYLWSVTITQSCIHLACLLISSIYAPAINLNHCEETWEDLELIGTIEKVALPISFTID